MIIGISEMYTVTDRSRIADVRRAAARMASAIALDEVRAGQVALALTEAATNLVTYATQGQIVLNAFATAEQKRLQFHAIDQGPGMDLENCLKDGFSTAGTPGNGLGAIRRISSEFDAYSSPAGTVLFCAFVTRPIKTLMQVGSIRVPIRGETVCGDNFHVLHNRENCTILVADGLGHGVLAAEAADEAVRLLGNSRNSHPAALLQDVHSGLRATRGAAGAIAQIRLRGQSVTYAGLGNISASLCTGQSTRQMVSNNGTIGQEPARIKEFEYPWSSDTLLVMHSDGVQTRWQLDSYPGLRRRHPAVIAGVLYRDFSRGRDDVGIVVAREA
jgi:anti-sigma regulatory factor (Ser/Thr protein kinase)